MHMKANLSIGKRLRPSRVRASVWQINATTLCRAPTSSGPFSRSPNSRSPQQAYISFDRQSTASFNSSAALKDDSSSNLELLDSEQEPTAGSSVRFADFQERLLLKSSIVANIPFENCTDIQAKTLEAIVQGKDVVARSPPGSGRTFAYLVPVLDSLLSDQEPVPSGKISVLIIVPTRDLVYEVARQAGTLLAGTGISVETAVGGTNLKTEKVRVLTQKCDVLIATAGRLLDHLAQDNIAVRLSDIKTLVFDDVERVVESNLMDQALDLVRQLEDVRSQTSRPRQTLAFGARFESETLTLITRSMRPESMEVATGAVAWQTRPDINHYYIAGKRQDVDAILLLILRQALQQDSKTKLVVFYPHARAAELAYLMFSSMPELVGFPVYRLHGNLKVGKRRRSLNQFRTEERGLMLATDVLRYALDIGTISTICHMSVPGEPIYYSERLGQLAAGGQSIFILADEETAVLTTPEIRGINFMPYEGPWALNDPGHEGLQSAQAAARSAMDVIDVSKKRRAYQSFLGFYKGMLDLLGWTKEDLVRNANFYAFECLRYKDSLPPPLGADLAKALDLEGVDGLNIVPFDVETSKLPDQEPKEEPRKQTWLRLRMENTFKARFGQAPASVTMGPLLRAAEATQESRAAMARPIKYSSVGPNRRGQTRGGSNTIE